MNKKLIIIIATIIPLIIVLSFYLYFENFPKRKIIKFQKNAEKILYSFFNSRKDLLEI